MAIINSAQVGNWNLTTTWVGGVVPSSTDEVHILHLVDITDSRELATDGKLYVDATKLTVTNTGFLNMLGGQLIVAPSPVIFDVQGRMDIRGGVFTANGLFDISFGAGVVNIYGGTITWRAYVGLCSGARLNIYGGILTATGEALYLVNGSSIHSYGGSWTIDSATVISALGDCVIRFHRREAAVRDATDGHHVFDFQGAYGFARRPRRIG